MSTGNGSSVLAIGIDAAEATFVRGLIDQDEMPTLKSLLENGQWLRVQSPAHIGSGAVWPTFITGQEPTVHGVYSEWSWCPETMSLNRYHGGDLTPFWKRLAQQDASIGVFDVPFAQPVGMSHGFEVCEWWAHDSTGTGLQAGPAAIRSVVQQCPAHPLSAKRFVNTTPDGDLKELAAATVAGVRLRGALAQRLMRETCPQFSLVVFPEIHHASHQMWHTVESDHEIYRGRKLNGGCKPAPLLKEVYRAVDEQIAGLIDAAGREASVMVFALHGMRPSFGCPEFLGPLLCEQGFSRLTTWPSQSWTGRARSLLAEIKRRTPVALKNFYYALTPTAATHKLARQTILPLYDWENTHAFSLPTDQNGWIRINLIGREAQGSVPLDQYDETCRQLEQLLLCLVNDKNESLVQDVVRTTANSESALVCPLPDLVVHWKDAAFAHPVRIKDSKVRVEPVGKKYTGQHAADGFCIYRGGCDWETDGVAARDLGRMITASL